MGKNPPSFPNPPGKINPSRNELLQMAQCLDARPKIRSLTPQLMELQDGTFVGLSDPARLCQGTMLLSPPAYRLTQLMNGLLERPEILRLAADRLGIRLTAEQLGELIDSLDEYRLLDNATTRGYLEQLPARPAAHAGSAYPEQPQELKAFLDNLLDQPLQIPHFSSRAYLIPHIDLERGRESYAQAWNHLRPQLEEFDTFVILGISHAHSQYPFVLTRKDFDTPLGRAQTDLEAVEKLAGALPFDPFVDEFNHLGEHSVEFQVLFLQHLCQRPFKVVPILCGSFHDCLTSTSWPEEQSEVSGFLDVLRDLLATQRRCCWIASVDLAHMGQRFGGPRLSSPGLELLQQQDLATMQYAVDSDARGFLQSLKQDRGERNYCGTSAIYSLLRILEPPPGRLLHYQQCNEPGLTSTVTVAAACYPC